MSYKPTWPFPSSFSACGRTASSLGHWNGPRGTAKERAHELSAEEREQLEAKAAEAGLRTIGPVLGSALRRVLLFLIHWKAG